MPEGDLQRLEARLQAVIDRHEIEELRARFFRLLDLEKDWDAWRELFTDDLRYDFGDGNWQTGADAFVAAVHEQMDGAAGKSRSVHHGHMPEITIDSPTKAHGIWVLADYMEWPSETAERSGFMGYGHEFDTYRKDNGVWKISSWRLGRIRMDPLPREPLPENIIGGPKELHDDQYMDKVTYETAKT
jgi:hypothetical protein